MGRPKKIKPFRYLVRDRASSGQLRLYYRAPDEARVRIHVGEDHPDFAAHYAAAKAGDPLPALDAQTESKPTKPTAGTFRALVQSYSKSAAFAEIMPDGQRATLGILESCCAEIWPENKKPIGDLPITRLAARHVQFLQDRKAGLPGAANNRVKYLRILLNWAGVQPNPARAIKMLKPKNKDGFHAWTLAEVQQFEAKHPIGTRARLALDLTIYTAARRADICKLGPANVSIDDGMAWISFVQGKTAGAVTMPILDALVESISATPTGETTFVANLQGKRYSVGGFGNAFAAWCDEAKLPHCRLHGLRKAAAARLAVLGCSEPEIQAITGHATSDEVQRYIRSASRRTMAGSAMAKLRESIRAKPAPLQIEGPK